MQKGIVKDTKNRVEGGKVGKWRNKGGLPRAHTGLFSTSNTE